MCYTLSKLEEDIMLTYVKRLEETDFVDLMVSIGQMRYGDNSRLYEYLDKGDKRVVHLWDNNGSFKDNGQDYIWVNDYEISNPSLNFNHHVFMLYRFGQEWYTNAIKYFEGKKPEGLDVLTKAKEQYDDELNMHESFIKYFEDGDALSI